MSGSRPHAVPGGGSALKPPPARPVAPGTGGGGAEAAPTAAPAPVAPPASPEYDPTPAAAVADFDVATPAPPPATRRHSREQLNTKIRVDLRQRLNQFVERHDSTVQGVLEAALDEYMARRGWTWDDYHRAARRR
jgi:hypothetical protein